MKLLQISITYLLFAWTGTMISAQEVEINISKYGFEDGLTHRNVFKVQQDTSGLLWIATAQGLNRFDGHGFLTWRSFEDQFNLPNSHIQDLKLDERNRLLLAFAHGGLAILDLANNQVDTVKMEDSIPRNAQFNHLSEDGKGKLWGIAHLPKDTSNWLVSNLKGENFSKIVRLPGHYKNRPMTRIGGLTYVGAAENEIWVFDLNGQQASQFEFPAPEDNPSYSRVIDLQTTSDGTLWALLNHGQVYSLAPMASVFQPHEVNDLLPENFQTSSFCIGLNQDIWVSGLITSPVEDENSPCRGLQPGPSLFHFNSATSRLEDFSYYLRQVLPYSEPPRQIFKDKTGVIWMATAFGLIKLVDHDLFARYMADGNDCCRDGVCSMRGITEDDEGNLYFSYYSSIHQFNPQTGSLVPFFSTQLGAPFGILYDQGYLYTGEGLRINTENLQVDTIIMGLTGKEGVVMKDGKGSLWFGNQNKIIEYRPSSGRSTNFPFSKEGKQDLDFKQVTWLHPSHSKGVFWMATIGSGIYEMIKGKGVGRVFNTKTTPDFPHDRILALCETAGNLWFGSAAGLGCLNLENGKLKTYTTKNGLPNNFVNGVLSEGDSAIWASTDNGLSRLDLGTNQFTNFFKTDGISSNEFNRSSFYRASNGRMYFGGIDGINAFFPSDRYGQRDDKTNSHLVLTEFDKFNGDGEVRQMWGFTQNQKFELSHYDEMFSFKFTLADYTDPKMHLYSYQLDGYDQEWSDASPFNFARYFNIPAGKYTMRVRASRGGGDWVEEELAMPVVISQAFYKTVWFQILALALITLFVYGIMRYRLYLLKQHEQELEELVKIRTSELEAEKQKSEELLLNILPADTAEELKKHGKTVARRYENVTVMFSDFKDFSIIATDMEPEDLVAEIDLCFRAFDEITELYGLEKIKTVGDAYLLAGGISSGDDEEDAARVVRAALEIQSFLHAIMMERKEHGRSCFEARIGIHTGPVVAGIVGIKKFAYDIWGDTVNIAERLQSSGETGKVNISKSTYELVKNRFNCTYRGKIEAKNKGEVDMYFVNDIKPS